jgi:hypothetical protein
MSNTHSPVSWSDTAKLLEAIKVANVLTDEHGRQFGIKRWTPSIEVGEVVKITAEMIVYLPNEEIKTP